MRLIDGYIVRSLIGPILGVAFILATVMLVFYSAQHLADAVAEQHPLSTVMYLAFLRMVIYLDVILPAAICLGVIVGLGQLYASNEITALMAAGGGPARLVVAVLWPALVLALLVAVISVGARPAAFQQVYDSQAELAVRIDPGRVDPGRFVAVDREWMIFADRRQQDVLSGVLIQRRTDTDIELLRAGRLHKEEADGRVWLVLSEGVHAYQFKRGGDPELVGYFDEMEIKLSPPAPPTRQRLRRALPLSALLAEPEPDYIAEWQWRLIAPVSAVLLALVAIPMSRVNPRQGRGSRILSGTLVVVVYFSTLGTAMHWVETERVAMWPGAWWVPGLLAVGVAGYALWQGWRWLRRKWR